MYYKIRLNSNHESYLPHLSRTHGQNQRRVGSRVGSGDGWGWEEWWGGNGDNCSWTTIKKKVKNRIFLSKEKYF